MRSMIFPGAALALPALLVVPCVAGTPPIGTSSDASPAAVQRIVPVAEQEGDPQSPRYLIMLGRYDEAEKRARAILDQHGGHPDSPEAAEALLLLVDALMRQTKTNLPETRSLVEESVEVSRKVFGEHHRNYALSLGSLALLRFTGDDFDGAREAYRQSLAILEESEGARSADLAIMQVKLATVEGVTGHFPEAGSLLERAVGIVGSLPVIDNPDVGSVLHNYATYLYNMGDLQAAEKASLRSLEFRRRMLPSPHPAIGYSLMSLGFIRGQLGDYASSGALLEQALAMSEPTLGPNHRQVGLILADLAVLRADTGRLDLAIQYQERASAISRAVLGEDSSDYWQTVSALGDFRARAGDWEGSLGLLRAALAGQEKKFGPVHQEVGVTLLALAEVEAKSGDAVSAAEHYRRGIDVFSKLFGPKHPEIAKGLDGLAHLSVATGALDDADATLRQALTINEEILGPEHPQVAEALVDLARLEWSRGDGAGALRDAFRAEAILQRHFGAALRGFSEREALAYQRIRATGLGVVFSVLTSMAPSDRPADAVTEAWSAVVRSRSLVLDQIASRHEFAGEGGRGAPAGLMDRLAAAANRLARVVVQGPSVAHPEAYRARFERALAEKERLEHELALAYGTDGDSATNVSLPSVGSMLPAGTGLVSFVQFPRPEGNDYGVLILRKDDPAPRLMDLGRVADIDALVTAWRRQTAPPGSGSLASGSRSERDYRRAGARLRERVWDPFAGSLDGLKQVLIVPEGSLALVSFAALPSGNDRYLLESAPILHYLSAERDLLRVSEPATASTTALVMGDPDFDVAPPRTASAIASPTAEIASAAWTPKEGGSYRGVPPGCQDFQKLHFEGLPGAGNEITAIEKQILGAAPDASGKPVFSGLTGAQASEPSFKQWAPGRTLIHLATHGFFLASDCGEPLGDPAPQSSAVAGHEDPLHGAIDSADPLLRSGLALAGANRRSQAGADTDDGILTSEEIAAMDLSSAQWVVLSACETGLGAIQAGEGVLGLRRAFRLARARTIIMSLWKVDDRATIDWMRRLYEGRDAGLSTAEAVQKASLDSLKARRELGRSTHPFYWGGFVAAGDWR